MSFSLRCRDFVRSQNPDTMQIAHDIQLITDVSFVVCRAWQNNHIIGAAYLSTCTHLILHAVDGENRKGNRRQITQFAIDWKIPYLLAQSGLG